MKTLSLKEAYSKLDKGPSTSLSKALFSKRDKIEGALMKHAFNVLPEVVEALEDAAHSLEQAAIDTKATMARHLYIAKAKKMWAIHAKASTVEVPE